MNYFLIIFIFYFFKLAGSDSSLDQEKNKSEHIHGKKHELTLDRIYNLGKKFDQEVEKLEAGQKYNFDLILKAMIHLSTKIECLACRKTYQGNIFYNKNTVIPNLEKQLKNGKLPKLLTED